MPWSPIDPLKMTRSPARADSPTAARRPERCRCPVVLIKRPSPLPFSTTLVSPVTIATPAAAAARAIEAAMRLQILRREIPLRE